MPVDEYETKITIYANEKTTKRIERALDFYYDKEDIQYYIERPLTERESDVLKLIAKGKNNTVIAKILEISPHTVKAHVKSIMEKLCAEDRIQAAVKAVKEHII